MFILYNHHADVLHIFLEATVPQSSEITVWAQYDISGDFLVVKQILSDINSDISCAVACLKVLGIDCVSYAYAEAALTCILSS